MNPHYQLIVIGSGSAGKEAALLAGRAGLQTLLIEAAGLGGTAVHWGVHAVRALRACATHLQRLTERDGRFGTAIDAIDSDWRDWLTVQRATSRRLSEDLARVLDQAKVTVKFGRAKLTGPNEVLLSGTQGPDERLSAQHVIIATGSRPGYPGLEAARLLNSDQLLRNTVVPGHLLVIGGGYIGCELAAIHRALGARVTLAEAAANLLPGWEQEAGTHLRYTLEAAGVQVLLNEEVELSAKPAAPSPLRLKSGVVLEPDLTLVATGRRPNVEGLGLECLGLAGGGFVPVNERLQTRAESVFAIGDVNGLSLLDSVASAQARVAVQTILGVAARFDLHWIPRCLHTQPPIAAAGWTEPEAQAAGQSVEVLSRVLRLVSDDDASVLEPEPTRLKVLVEARSGRLLGCLVIGHHAVEMVNLVSAALCHGLTARQLTELSPVHPSASEALVHALQEWRDRLY